MNQNKDLWITKHRDQAISLLQALIRIPSVIDSPAPNAPFGLPCRQALTFMLDQFNGAGFKTCDLDGYAGYGEYGSGAKMLGILTHLDVVPAGEGWQTPPFGPVIKNNILYGRGALDDKGPAVASFFALLALKECGYKVSKRVRLIMGCNEENGMDCMAHYCQTDTIPDLAFSPDAAYPLVNAEKGIFRNKYSCPSSGTSLRMQAGVASNVLPGKATVYIPLNLDCVDTFFRKYLPQGYSYELDNNESGTRAVVNGLSTHASTPELGRNAIQAALQVLKYMPLPDNDLQIVQCLSQSFGMDVHGESLGIDRNDESGRLTLCFSVLNWTDDKIELEFNVRYPVSCDWEQIKSALDQALFRINGYPCSFVNKPGHFVPEDDPLVKSLLSVYEKRTGECAASLKTGAGTYARCFPHAVAFGPERPNRTNLIHMPDEHIHLEDFIEDIHIISDAIIELAT